MRTAVAYCRVSTPDQSIDAQKDAIIAWANREGVTIVAWFDDVGVSGAAPIERWEGLARALAALREHGATYLAAAKRDRLARDVVLAALIERLAGKAKAKVATADGTTTLEGPEGQLMRTLIDAFAAYERHLIGARTKAALQAKRSRGERIGGVPFGYRVVGKNLEPNPAEQSVVAMIRRLAASGLSQRAIVERLNGEGVPARGRQWHRTSVARVLERKTPVPGWPARV